MPQHCDTHAGYRSECPDCLTARKAAHRDYYHRTRPLPPDQICIFCSATFADRKCERCPACRAARFVKREVCGQCGTDFLTRTLRVRFCSQRCGGFHAEGIPSDRMIPKKRGIKRRRAELAAPGLRAAARTALKKRWIIQGRLCIYCLSRPADSIDHVVPLRLGGTHFEGNLVPACMICNRSKSDLLLVAWRRQAARRKLVGSVDATLRRLLEAV